MMQAREAFGAYWLLERIGCGGMAEVFRAEPRRPAEPGRSYALKRILPGLAASPELVRMLSDEARIMSMLNHPNIVRVHDWGSADGAFYLSMEYLEGCSLARLVKAPEHAKEPLRSDVIAHIVHAVCRALGYAHALADESGRPLRLIHRDVSPGNIMLLTSGEVKLLDFGVAKIAGHVRSTRTRLGVVKGKAAYMAPEQVRGEPLDHRADIFALGIVLWELLAARPLFRASTVVEAAREIMGAPIVAPSTLRAGVPPALERVAMRALERRRERRYANAEEMAIDLSWFLAERRDPREALRALVRPVATRSATPMTPHPAVDVREPEAATRAQEPAGLELAVPTPITKVPRLTHQEPELDITTTARQIVGDSQITTLPRDLLAEPEISSAPKHVPLESESEVTTVPRQLSPQGLPLPVAAPPPRARRAIIACAAAVALALGIGALTVWRVPALMVGADPGGRARAAQTRPSIVPIDRPAAEHAAHSGAKVKAAVRGAVSGNARAAR